MLSSQKWEGNVAAYKSNQQELNAIFLTQVKGIRYVADLNIRMLLSIRPRPLLEVVLLTKNNGSTLESTEKVLIN